MAEDTISDLTAEPGKLAELLRLWNAEHQKLYANKRAAMEEHRKKCVMAGEVDPQWPNWSEGSLKASYLSSLGKVSHVSEHLGIQDTLHLNTLVGV